MRQHAVARLIIVGLVSFRSVVALAADSYKTVAINLPILAPFKLDFNLKAHGALSMEFNAQKEKKEYYTKDQRDKSDGDSLMTNGTQITALFTQFSNAKMMSGGYWALGLGYQKMDAVWQKSPATGDEPTGVSLNADGKIDHELTGNGLTGHGRIGYRYVGESVPFLAGIQVGLKHFNSKFKDSDEELLTATSKDEKESLQRMFMTSSEIGIEIGFAF